MRNTITILLFIASFVVLSLSGYQCATETRITDPEPTDTINPDPPPSPPPISSTPATLPSTPEGYDEDSCRQRSRIRNAYSHASGKIDLDSSALNDFRLGKRGNFDTDCARLFVKLNGTTYNNDTVYQGSIKLAYLGTCSNGEYGICRSEMRTGYSSSDARFNTWSVGNRYTKKPTERNVGRAKFHGIFEDTYGAYILKLEDIRERDLSDGEVIYVGAGELYYKMFRIGTPEDIRQTQRRGDCYNGGGYISQAHHSPPRPSVRCWLTKLGPFSCRPEGDLLSNDQLSDINLRNENYKCFSHFGNFYGLDIEEAFNIKI